MRDDDERRVDLEYGMVEYDGDGGGGGGEYSNDDLVYGMHILERDGSSPDDDEFHEVCDELGVTPATHPGIRHFYRRHHHHPVLSRRLMRYRYPMLRSRKFRRAMVYFAGLLLIALVCVAVMSAVSNGFEAARQRGAPPLPDWREEVDRYNVQKEEWERVHGGGQAEDLAVGDGSQQLHDGGKIETELFARVSAAYRPVWYDRATGWTGRSYDEVLPFCASHHPDYAPCPYEVYCPDGKTLISGVVVEDGEDGESWAPVVNARDEWVQIGTGGEICALYSPSRDGYRPSWGLDGIHDEAITRHIMCCLAHPLPEGGAAWGDDRDPHVVRPDGPPAGQHDGEGAATTEWPSESGGGDNVGGEATEPPPSGSTGDDDVEGANRPSSGSTGDLEELFVYVAQKYNPMWFDRDTGFTGRTYQESLDFCASVWAGYIPCPYDAVRDTRLGTISKNVVIFL
jgi:hypothetical protein